MGDLSASLCACCTVQWLEKDFLSYLKEWEEEVRNSKECPAIQAKMLLSWETLEGLRITGKLLNALTLYTLTLFGHCFIVVRMYSDVVRRNDQVSTETGVWYFYPE